MKKDVHSIRYRVSLISVSNCAKYRVLNEYVMPNLTKRNELKLGDMPITFHDIKVGEVPIIVRIVTLLYACTTAQSVWRHVCCAVYIRW